MAGQALVGVAVLSVPMRAQVLTDVFDLEPYTEALELGRFVLTDTPANAEFWMLSRVFELAADEGLRGLVSFSDPMPRQREVLDIATDGAIERRMETLTPGHVGVIYQATNGRACGRLHPPAPSTTCPAPAWSSLSERCRRSAARRAVPMPPSDTWSLSGPAYALPAGTRAAGCARPCVEM